MKKILCIEDQPDYQEILRKTLKDYNVKLCATLSDARQTIEENEFFDLAIIDVSLPDGDGIRFYSVQKEYFESNKIPVVFLSSSTDIENKLTALRLGADDYLCKPIHPLELKVRVESKIEKSQKSKEEDRKIKIGDLQIDILSQSAQDLVANKAIDFTSIEFKLLLHFSRNIGNVLSRDQILDQVWGTGVSVQDRTVDTHVSHLRKKISHLNLKIESVLGMGYRMQLEDVQDE